MAHTHIQILIKPSCCGCCRAGHGHSHSGAEQRSATTPAQTQTAMQAQPETGTGKHRSCKQEPERAFSRRYASPATPRVQRSRDRASPPPATPHHHEPTRRRCASPQRRAPRRRCANGSLCTPFRGRQAGKTAGAKQATTVPSSAARGPLWPAARSARIQNPKSRSGVQIGRCVQSLETAGVIITCMPGGLELQSALRILDLDSGFLPSESRIQNPESRL